MRNNVRRAISSKISSTQHFFLSSRVFLHKLNGTTRMRISTALSATTSALFLSLDQTECLTTLFLKSSTFTSRNHRPVSNNAFRLKLKANTIVPIFSSIGNNNNNNSDDNVLLESLKKRANELQIQKEALLQRWKDAKCTSKARIVIDDWVRRISLGNWPFVAIGSAGGSLYLADCNTCEVIAQVNNVHNPLGGNDEAISYLHGTNDGGGTLAIAMTATRVVSAGREGGAKLFNIVTPNEEETTTKKPMAKKNLVPMGELTTLKGALVTSLCMDNDEQLWVGCYDGNLHVFDLDSLSTMKNISMRVEAGILCVDVNNDIGLAVCGMTNGSVKMFSLDGAVLALWKPFSSFTFVRSVKLVGGPDDNSWCVVAGSGDGQLMARQLLLDSAGMIERVPFDNQRSTVDFTPQHGGSIVSLATRQGGLLISAAQDGTIRVWDCWVASRTTNSNYSDFEVKPKLLYNFVGYKVWLGSVCSDRNHLLSDGADNAIIVHDFSVPVNYD